ncbi:MAG: hypothetical protein A2908_03090 [Candidatus Staskawiczbacteria bacterium RIFCSPLOWO2_01_FULL_38_12b]|uniref:Uncharacterized protein n=1 Tax=Candidatus Staskawiczbacteria bacterium RIFCSPLOWO2_01_FULL_38_12b TaxID=1802214 RepID=A0A1G2ICC7_9BACT|nr:MAG: hypothetical protein A2908_03090 [Candidatus Staskawiczbacteria bacterium RIFCSPLOWO2_01_FULL_38_12b]
MKANAQMMSVVQKRGKKNGTDNSLKIASTTHNRPIFITNPKNPRVIMRRGRVMVFKIGFTKKLSNPKTIPKRIKSCHVAVRGNPKKLEPGYIVTVASAKNIDASQNPSPALMIAKISLFIGLIIADFDKKEKSPGKSAGDLGFSCGFILLD